MGDNAAVSFGGAQSSFAQLADSTIRSARKLRAAGIGSGDRVAILLREASEDYISLAFGAMRLGAICLAVNARNKVSELQYVFDHADPGLIIYAEEFEELVAKAEEGSDRRRVVLGADPDFEAGEGLVSEAEVRELSAAVTPETPAVMLYTSGTTANPKGCLLTHEALLAEGWNCAERMRIGTEDRLWTPMTMFHVGGWQNLMTTMVPGAAFSHPGFFEPDAALRQLEEERCTIAFPAFELIWLGVLEHPRFAAADLSAMRVVINVGVRERLEAMQAMLPTATQVSCVGMTESCGSICMGAEDDPPEKRTTTSGRPLNGLEVRIVDPETGGECATDESGEFQFRGITSFVGYYRDAENTEATIIEDGWVRTGDLASVDEEGMVQFRGRIKDVLKVGGENASAQEIEGFLLTHPAIAVAAVVAAADARYGEVPVAFVQRAAGEEVDEQAVIEFCLGKIASFKVPRYVRFVDEFPTTASEKIKKFTLREAIEAELESQGITEAPRLRQGSASS